MAPPAQSLSENPEFTPDNYPPIPPGLPSVTLKTISLSELESGEQAEEDRLFLTCKTQGFFYLDLTGSHGASLIGDTEKLARLAEEVFKLPLDEKEKYLPGKTIFGYKRVGATQTDSEGTPDTVEFFNVSKDDMLASETSLHWPRLVLDNRALFDRYIHTAHAVGVSLLSILAVKIGLPHTAFSKLHRIDRPSGDHVRMTRGPPRVSPDKPEIQTPGHTDFGSITILFNWLGGLQIWSESSRGDYANVVDPATRNRGGGQWLWVAPRPGHAIVNLGDAMVKFTNGVFCSGRHRVVPAPGEQGVFPRYSIVYFVRPEDDVVLKPLHASGIPGSDGLEDEEEEITAKDWIRRQAKGLGTRLAD